VVDDALQGEGLATGLNVHRGRIVQPVVKNALGDLHA